MQQTACERWLDQLFDPRNELKVVLFGLSTVQNGWRVEPRQIDEHLVYFILQDRVEGMVAGKTIRLEPNDFLWLRPGVRHSFMLGSVRAPMRLYHLRFTLKADGRKRAVELPRPSTHLHHAEKMRSIMEQLFEEHRSRLVFSTWRFRALLTALLADALRSGSGLASQRKRKLTSPQRTKLESLFQSQKEMRITPEQLAGSLAMSPDYFARVFKNTFGLPPRIWIAHERIRRAADMLLETSLNVSQIADQLGYADLFTFSRQFKEIMASSPRVFRQSHL